MRNDIHSPKNLTPEDYEFKGFHMPQVELSEEAAEILGERCYMVEEGAGVAGQDFYELPEPLYNGNYKNKHTCDHCGAAHIYSAVFLHKPTGEHIVTGLNCAESIAKLDNAAMAHKRMTKLRKAEKTRLENIALYAAWANANPQDAQLLEFFAAGDDFAKKIRSSVISYRNYSAAQKACIEKIASEYVVEEVVADPVECGKRFLKETKTGERFEVVGQLVGVRQEEDQYGYHNQCTYIYKVMIKCGEDKIWMTAPQSMGGLERGTYYKFSATLIEKDENFFIGKRPTKVQQWVDGEWME